MATTFKSSDKVREIICSTPIKDSHAKLEFECTFSDFSMLDTNPPLSQFMINVTSNPIKSFKSVQFQESTKSKANKSFDLQAFCRYQIQNSKAKKTTESSKIIVKVKRHCH